MATDKIYSQGEIVDAIKAKAAALNLDSFRVRVNRRPAPHLQPDILATFGEVNLNHLMSPEMWLLELFGGGAFELSVAHESAPNDHLPGPLKYTYDPSNYPLKRPTYVEVINATSQTTWEGPLKLIYPRPPSAPPGIVTQTITPGVGVTKITAGETNPVTLTNTSSVGGAAVGPLAQVMGTSTNPVERQEAGRLMQVSESLEKKERELFEKQIELKMESMRPTTIAAPSGPGMMEVVAALTPLALQFLQSKQQMETMMFQAQQESAKQQMAMMQMMMAPKPMDPELRILLEQATKKDDNSNLKGMAEMMGTMANVSMQIIQSQAEMMAASQPQPEPPQYALARQALVALSGMMGSAKVSMAAPPEAPALPEGALEEAPQNGPRKYSQLELLEKSLRNRVPKEEAAERFVKAMKSKKFLAMVHGQYGGNFLNLVQDRLGTWAAETAENLEYLQEVIPFIWSKATEEGLVPSPVAPPAPAHTAPAHTTPPQTASEPEKSDLANGQMAAPETAPPATPAPPKRVKASPPGVA